MRYLLLGICFALFILITPAGAQETEEIRGTIEGKVLIKTIGSTNMPEENKIIVTSILAVIGTDKGLVFVDATIILPSPENSFELGDRVRIVGIKRIIFEEEILILLDEARNNNYNSPENIKRRSLLKSILMTAWDIGLLPYAVYLPEFLWLEATSIKVISPVPVDNPALTPTAKKTDN